MLAQNVNPFQMMIKQMVEKIRDMRPEEIKDFQNFARRHGLSEAQISYGMQTLKQIRNER